MPSPPLEPLVAWGRSLGLAGEPEQVARRPWSTTERLGGVWLKACGPGGRYEVILLRALREWGPPGVALPLAVEPSLGFAALPDAGAPLRGIDGGADRWPQIAARHAALQRELQPRAPELLALGVPDLTPARAPDLLTDLLSRHDPPPEVRSAVEAALPGLAADCAALSEGPVAVSLQHDDLHDGNVMVGDEGVERLIDWGDSCVGHPFGVLLVTLRSLRHRHGWDHTGDDAALDRVRDAYLEVWSDLAGLAELRELAAAAQRVQTVGRALSWERALTGADDAERAELEDPVTGWLGVVGGMED